MQYARIQGEGGGSMPLWRRWILIFILQWPGRSSANFSILMDESITLSKQLFLKWSLDNTSLSFPYLQINLSIIRLSFEATNWKRCF
jgi:hypothetical protein